MKWAVKKNKKEKRGEVGKLQQHARGGSEREKGYCGIRALAGFLTGQTISVSAQIRRKYSIRLDEQACGG